jgi:hypothetical protein
MHGFLVFTGVVYLLVFPLFPHRPTHPENDSLDDVPLFSPSHKRTEGCAPVWGSEFSSKDATLRGGGPAETTAGLNVKLWALVVTD